MVVFFMTHEGGSWRLPGRKPEVRVKSGENVTDFETKMLADRADATAPDGSEVRLLPAVTRGSMAHFALAAGATSRAVTHRSVEEIWFFLGGVGEMWRRAGDQEEVVQASAGVAVSIPLGTHFQFRAVGTEPLTAVGVTMPPWPGDDEAIEVAGPWEATV
jgi:mannose-6-phosphate isomerase-like protein (cupin superfamily)